MLHGRQDWTSSSKPINFHPTDHSPSNSSESLSSSSISSSLSSSSSSSSSGSSTDVLHKTSLPDWVTPAYTSSSLPSRSRGSVEAALINSHHVLDRAVCGKATSIRSPFEWTTLLNALKRLEIKGLLQRTEPPNKGNPHNTYQTNHQTSGKTGSRETRRRRDVKGKGKETSSLSIAASKSLGESWNPLVFQLLDEPILERFALKYWSCWERQADHWHSSSPQIVFFLASRYFWNVRTMQAICLLILNPVITSWKLSTCTLGSTNGLFRRTKPELSPKSSNSAVRSYPTLTTRNLTQAISNLINQFQII